MMTNLKNKEIKQVQRNLEHNLKDKLLADPSEKNFQEAYDEIHTFFMDNDNVESLYSTDLTWFSQIFVELSGTQNKVLDIGSGNGKLAIAMAKRGNTVSGLDVSKIAIQKSQELNKKIAPDIKVEFKNGDARNLPFENESFDYITSQDLIEHISEDDFKIHLSEVYRVLKPGGRYMFWTPSELRGGSSLGLHLKEYTIYEIDKIIGNTKFKYSWFDLRFYKIKIKIKINQSFMLPVILYERLLSKIIKFLPEKINHVLVPRLLFQLKK
jgi:ubiquinone/menaquinone biosynthesis C-methylase UbiE